MTTPNLFSFATSELSQDAFLCWIASLAASDHPDLALTGKRFVAWLWESARRESVLPERIKLLRAPERQFECIDVLLHAEVNGQAAAFLIEDKTGTSHHSDQLRRYGEIAAKRCELVVPIYFKTGHHFGEDVAAAAAEYTVIGLEAWVAFLQGLDLQNDILADYRAYVSELLRNRAVRLAELWTPEGYVNFREDYVQFEFLRDLARRLSASPLISRGTNIGGTPWTHLNFTSSLGSGTADALFHRVDKRKAENGEDRYYLSTRQYAQVKGNPEARKAKLERLKRFRELFDQAVKEASPDLMFSKPAADY